MSLFSFFSVKGPILFFIAWSGEGGRGETEIFGQGHMVFRGNGEGNQSSSTEYKGGV